MKTWIAFFIVECKRTWKTLLKSIGSFCACLLLTAVLVAAFSAIMLNAQVFQKVNIGIAIPEGESISRLATQYISSMDSVRSVCDFYYLDEQESVEQLKQGTLQAVVVLPEGFYHDVQVGINPPAQIYFPKDAAQNTQVFEELVTAGVSFLQTAEAGVYAALDTASYYGVELQGAGLGNTIAYLFAHQMLKRDSVYSARMLSTMGNLSVAEYYYAAGLVILLMMCGIQFGFLYGKRNRSVEDKLKIRGVGSIRQSVVKILVMTEFLYVTGLLYYFAGIGVAGWTKTYFVFYQGTTWYALLLLCLGIAIYFHVLYELSGSICFCSKCNYNHWSRCADSGGLSGKRDCRNQPFSADEVLECICGRNAGRRVIQRSGNRNGIFPVCWNGGRDASFLGEWKERAAVT